MSQACGDSVVPSSKPNPTHPEKSDVPDLLFRSTYSIFRHASSSYSVFTRLPLPISLVIGWFSPTHPRFSGSKNSTAPVPNRLVLFLRSTYNTKLEDPFSICHSNKVCDLLVSQYVCFLFFFFCNYDLSFVISFGLDLCFLD